MPERSLASVFPEYISVRLPFSTSINFRTLYTKYANQTIGSATAFTFDMTGAIPGASSVVELISSAGNTPTFAASAKQSTGSNQYDSRAGIVNLLTFFYDGDAVWYSIVQEVTGPPVDTIIPARTGISYAANVISLTYSEPLDAAFLPPLSAFSATPSKTFSSVSLTNGNQINLTLASALTESIALAYTAGSIRDTAGNLAASFSGVTVAPAQLAMPLVFSIRTSNIAASGDDYIATSPAYVTTFMIGDRKIPSSADGWYSADYMSAQNVDCIVGFSSQNINGDYSGDSTGNPYKYFCWVSLDSGVARLMAGGVGIALFDTGFALGFGASYRLARESTAVKVQKREPNATAWDSVYTFPSASTTDLFLHANLRGARMDNPTVSGSVAK